MSSGQKHIDKENLTDRVISEKLYSAESYSATVRLAVVLINTVAYVFLMDKENTIQWLAYSVMVAALIYSFYVVLFRPFERYAIQRTSYLTAISDGVFIVLWIMSTGYAASPFYLLWYVSIVAVGQRFAFRETLMVSAVYALSYVILLRVDIGAIVSAEMFLRVLYIPVTGVLAAFFAREFENQVEDKLKARTSEIKAIEAQGVQQQLLVELHTIKQNLEQMVEQRTTELEQLNENLKQEIEQKEVAQRAQQQSVESLERINQELESFAYVTSHDLKAPLRGIATIADWLQSDYEDKLDEDGKVNLRLLKQRVQRMNDLIDGILKYSKVGRLDEQLEDVEFGELVQECVDLLPIPEKMKVSIDGSFPVTEGNRTLMFQVIQNLLSNAYKFANEESGLIRVEGKFNDQEWIVSVSDNGKGIPEAYHEKVFEMFQSLEDKNDGQSTGVGLAIVKKVVTGWGGRIWVTSPTDGGASFHFTIPHKMIKTESA
ncbi:MAG: hypothetical protein KBF73_03920 [Flavobacteriales bacterium]|nr:hypothetical protein [Flavobacteriales bacterium]